MPKTKLDMYMCNLKGDTINGADTAGILGINANIIVKESTFAHFKSGGIMLQCLPQTMVLIERCNIVTCETNGIYIQGKASRPNIIKNKFLFCRSTAIKTNLDVDANVSEQLLTFQIRENEINLCEAGIEIFDNSSFVLDNQIIKSHKNGITIVGNNPSTRCTPMIWRNVVTSCGWYGVITTGIQAEPDIRGNIISYNRKAGIKITDQARAQIGGTTKQDIKFIPQK